jgi:hypothetical protein
MEITTLVEYLTPSTPLRAPIRAEVVSISVMLVLIRARTFRPFWIRLENPLTFPGGAGLQNQELDEPEKTSNRSGDSRHEDQA